MSNIFLQREGEKKVLFASVINVLSSHFQAQLCASLNDISDFGFALVMSVQNKWHEDLYQVCKVGYIAQTPFFLTAKYRSKKVVTNVIYKFISIRVEVLTLLSSWSLVSTNYYLVLFLMSYGIWCVLCFQIFWFSLMHRALFLSWLLFFLFTS